MQQTPIQQAQSEIEKILRNLQHDHGILIDSIDIVNLDISTVDDKNKKHLMQIRLTPLEIIERSW